MAAQWHGEGQAKPSKSSDKSKISPYTVPVRFPHLARIADMLRESTSSRRLSITEHSRATAEHQDTTQTPNQQKRRESTSQRIHDAWTAMTTNTHKRELCRINNLPVELLQHVFMHLDMFTLLRIRRVCALWNELIPGECPLLQELLFLKPSKYLEAYEYTPAMFGLDFDVIRASGGEEDRALLLKKNVFRMTRRCLGYIRTSTEIIFHPIVVDFDRYLQQQEFRTPSMQHEGDHDKQLQPVWRNMLVSMPPLREVRVWRRKGNNQFDTLRVLEAEDGVRLGQVFDALTEWETDGKGKIWLKASGKPGKDLI